jgi:two-component system, OmpR family, sensor histidine kinase KdpD
MARSLSRVAGSVAAVAAATLLVWALDPIAPILSLGVIYIFAVLPVAIFAGLAYALPVAVASMLAFNFFFLPPTHTFTLSDSENWFALAVYSVTAVVVSELAARSRRRAAFAEQREREAALLADVAGHLLAGSDLEEERPWLDVKTAEVIGVPSVAIDPTDGSIRLPRGATLRPEVRDRFLPALKALLAVAVDRSRLKREALEAETLRRSDLVKTALLRAVSHDLRSPLTGITAAVGTLRNDSLTLTEADRSELLDTIAVDAARLGRLVGDLLDLSRLEAGSAQPEADVWALDDLVRESVDAAGARDLVEIGEANVYVNVDAVQIERALVNLIENAVKFTPPGGRVHVRATTTSDEVIVRVVDQGVGLPSTELERVFEPFYRRDTDSRGGAGLGLAIARGFVAANGGRVWAESRPGQGATFALALPREHVPAELERA